MTVLFVAHISSVGLTFRCWRYTRGRISVNRWDPEQPVSEPLPWMTAVPMRAPEMLESAMVISPLPLKCS
jgi:hypothetical protein